MTQQPRHPRYLLVTRSISVEEALKQRSDEIEQLALEAKNLLTELTALKTAPLPTSETHQEEILPGDPRYEQASEVFNPAYYVGEARWELHS
jgi:hypothetical protein